MSEDERKRKALELAQKIVDVYLKTTATAEDVEGQIESDWEMVAEIAGTPVPRHQSTRKLIAQMVRDQIQGVSKT